MPNNIGFRIVGMYFGAKASVTKEIRVDVPKENPTCYDVMMAVVAKVNAGAVPGVSSFSFVPMHPTSQEDLASVSITYTEKPVPTKPYSAGTYFLQDEGTTNPLRVLQYYVFDENMKQLNTGNFDFPFNKPNGVAIKDNYTIVWRQVSILTGPTQAPRIISRSQKASEYSKS